MLLIHKHSYCGVCNSTIYSHCRLPLNRSCNSKMVATTLTTVATAISTGSSSSCTSRSLHTLAPTFQRISNNSGQIGNSSILATQSCHNVELPDAETVKMLIKFSRFDYTLNFKLGKPSTQFVIYNTDICRSLVVSLT